MKKTKYPFVIMLCVGILCLAGPKVLADENTNRGLRAYAGDKTVSGYRLALVIGNSAYGVSPLKNPVHDAETMEAHLSRCGFEVIKACDLTYKEMKKKVDAFGKKLKKKGGTGLFYYAGHGLQVKGRNYLVPVDANIQSEEDVEYEAMDAGRVLAKMESAGNKLNIVILDACRDNPYTRSYRSSSQGLAHMDAPAGTLIAYSTAPGSVASDGSAGQGLYTGELVRYMAVPGLKIEDVFKHVRINVGKATGNRQVPWESSSLVGDFYFAGPSGEAPKTLPATVMAVEPVVQSLDGVWKRNGKKSFSIRIIGDQAVVTDTGFNKKIPGVLIMKNIRKKDDYWTADRAKISKDGKILAWGRSRLELNGSMLVEHIEVKRHITQTYERVE